MWRRGLAGGVALRVPRFESRVARNSRCVLSWVRPGLALCPALVGGSAGSVKGFATPFMIRFRLFNLNYVEISSVFSQPCFAAEEHNTF